MLYLVSHVSCVQLFATSWTVAHQAPLSMGIPQARILEWVAMPFSRGSSQPRDQTWVSCTAGRFFTDWATREAHDIGAQGNGWLPVGAEVFEHYISWYTIIGSIQVEFQPWINICNRYLETVMSDRVDCTALSSKHTQLSVTGCKVSNMSPAYILIFSPPPPSQDPPLPPIGHVQGPIGSVSYHPGIFLTFFLLIWGTCILFSACLNLLHSAQGQSSNSLHWPFFAHGRPDAFPCSS